MEHGEGMSGMDLGGDKTKPDGSEPDPAGKYGCPMHPDVVRDAPGTCPECGMALRPMQKHSDVEMLEYLRDKCPDTERVTMYANIGDILRKTVDDLKELRC